MAARVFRPGNKFKFGWQPESHRVYYGSAVEGDERAIDEASPGGVRASGPLMRQALGGGGRAGHCPLMRQARWGDGLQRACTIFQGRMSLVNTGSLLKLGHPGLMRLLAPPFCPGAANEHAVPALLHLRGRGGAALPRRRRVRPACAAGLRRGGRPTGQAGGVHAQGLPQREAGPVTGEHRVSTIDRERGRVGPRRVPLSLSRAAFGSCQDPVIAGLYLASPLFI